VARSLTIERAVFFLLALNGFLFSCHHSWPALPDAYRGQRCHRESRHCHRISGRWTLPAIRFSTLKKGGTVYVDLRMDQGGKSWCGVRPSAQANRIGFVDCRSLQRVAGSTPAVVSGRSAASSESTHGFGGGHAAGAPLRRPPRIGYAAMKKRGLSRKA